jgi:cysteine desulfurase
LNAQAPGKVVISSIEHPSVAAVAAEMARRGAAVEQARVSGSGVVELSRLRELLDRAPTRLVSVMLVNNETGVIQPVAEIAELCATAHVPLHTDAVQGVGKLPVNFRELGVTAMTVAAHKLHGPVGIGALVVRSDVSLSPLLFGGAQQLGMRPGTEPVALAVGMRKALELWRDEAERRAAHMTALRDLLERRLLEGFPDAIILGGEAPRAPHTANIAFPGVDRQAALIALDLNGVACSTGSACASGSSEPSPVLQAMHCPDAYIRSALRFSLSPLNTQKEIEEAAARIIQVARSLRRP